MSHRLVFAVLVIALAGNLAGCRGRSNEAPTPSSQDVQATIDAAVAATRGAEAALQATIEAAVAATAAAQPTATPGSTTPTTAPPTVVLLPATAPTPVPTLPPVDTVTMTEEELAALIEEAMVTAIEATAQASAASTQAAADDAVTPEEVQTVEVYVQGAEAAIAYAEELTATYADLYGELAGEAIATLEEIEADLDTMNESLAAIAASLEGINQTLAAGLELTEETIAQLESAAQAATASITQAQAQAWATSWPQQIAGRAQAALEVAPSAIPATLPETLQNAFQYVDLVQGAVGDGKISADELAGIAQMGANVSAGLKAHGGAQFQHLSGAINEVTAQLARGQVSQAQASLGSLEQALGPRPGGAAPALPAKPDLPAKPALPGRRQ